jgi:hypothetical protein
VRARGHFNVRTKSEIVPDISCRYCRILQRADGYSYQLRIFQSAGGEEGIALGNSSCKIDRSGNGLGVALGVRKMHFDQKRVARENLVIIVNNKTGRR